MIALSSSDNPDGISFEIALGYMNGSQTVIRIVHSIFYIILNPYLSFVL